MRHEDRNRTIPTGQLPRKVPGYLPDQRGQLGIGQLPLAAAQRDAIGVTRGNLPEPVDDRALQGGVRKRFE